MTQYRIKNTNPLKQVQVMRNPRIQKNKMRGFLRVTTAAKTWHKLKGENQLPKVVQGVTFRNGVEVTNTPAQNAA